jgi:hypothetical protein
VVQRAAICVAEKVIAPESIAFLRSSTELHHSGCPLSVLQTPSISLTSPRTLSPSRSAHHVLTIV